MTRGRVASLAAASLFGLGLARASAEDATPLPAGRIACASEDELDAYLAALHDEKSPSGSATLEQYPSCHRFTEVTSVAVLAHHDRFRVRIQVVGGPRAGFRGWTQPDAK